MAGYHVFGAGDLSVGNDAVGTCQEFSFEVTSTPVSLYGAKKYPLAVASGPATVRGRIKQAELDLTILASVLGLSAGAITNAVMGPQTVKALTWQATYEGFRNTVTIEAAVFTKFSLSARYDQFAVMDIDFEAFAAADDGVITITQVAYP